MVLYRTISSFSLFACLFLPLMRHCKVDFGTLNCLTARPSPLRMAARAGSIDNIVHEFLVNLFYTRVASGIRRHGVNCNIPK